MPVINLPNVITLARALLVPLLAYTLGARDYEVSLAIFLVCALGDFVDGWIARRFDQHTRFGAVADPLADKLTMLAVALMLAWHAWLPWWFVLLVVLRDLVIVTGAAAYHLRIGRLELAPTPLSKANTALEFALLACVLALASGLLGHGVWLDVLLWACTATVVASGIQYVVVWSRKAARETPRGEADVR